MGWQVMECRNSTGTQVHDCLYALPCLGCCLVPRGSALLWSLGILMKQAGPGVCLDLTTLSSVTPSDCQSFQM